MIVETCNSQLTTVRAEDVRVGDSIPGSVGLVVGIDTFDVHPMRRKGAAHSPGYERCAAADESWPVLRILGMYGIARFPHEMVTVRRAAKETA